MTEKSSPISEKGVSRAIIPSLLFVLVASVTLYTGAFRYAGIDFWHAWAVSGAVSRETLSDVYSRDARELLYRVTKPSFSATDSSSREQVAATTSAALDSAVLGYPGLNIAHTPMLLSLFWVIHTGSYEHDYLWFMAVSIVCFFASVVALGLLTGFSLSTSLVAAAALALTLDAEASELRVGNVNNIQLAMVTAFLVLQRRQSMWADIASGAALALVTALKPNVAPVVVAVVLTWVGDRLWRKLVNICLGFAIGALMAIGIPAALFPSATWSNWLGAATELLGGFLPLDQGNFAFSAVIAKLLGYDVPSMILGLGLLILGAAALSPLWSEHPNRSGKRESFERTFSGVSAGAMLILLSSRLVWIHYVILAIPALVLFLQNLMEQRQFSVYFLIGLAMLPLTSGFIAALKIVGTSTVWIAVAMNLSLFILFIFCMRRLWRSGEQNEVC